jgi:hypothetical protein
MSDLKTITTARLAALLPGLLLVVTPLRPAFSQPGQPSAPPAKTVAIGLPKVEPGSKEEIKLLLEKAPKASEYPNAASAVLLDLADITVKPDGSARTVTRMTKKIFNKRGRDDESEIKISYNNHYETMQIVWARTIKPDGTVIEVKPQDIRESRPSDYDDVTVKAFSMPAVDDDCIIDYQYVTEQKESMMPGNFWSQWYFQAGFDPVMLTKLTVTVPKSLKMQESLRNTPVKARMEELPDGQNVRYTWEDNNVAPLELEPMMPAAEKVLPTLHVSTVRNWQDIADWYYKMAKDRMVPDDAIKAKAQELAKGKATPEEKAKAIFYFVQEKTRYVAIELGKSAFQPRPASSILVNQYGDCKDMATLLVAMLREVGITAHPVLIEADDREEKSSQLPSPGAFNHAICLAEINGKKYWLDATAAICPWGVIPSSDRGCEVLVIRDGKGTWERIPDGSPDDNAIERTVKLKLNADGSASGTITMKGSGDNDMALRMALRDLPEQKRSIYMEELAKTVGTNPRVTNVQVSDYMNLDTPVTITMNIAFPSWASVSGDLLIFKAKPDQATAQSSSPFSMDFRKLPVVQNGFALGEATLELTLPENYTVLSLPKDADIKHELGRYRRTVKQEGKNLTIVTRGENYKAEIPSERYSDVRKYYESYLKAADESVIVKKN